MGGVAIVRKDEVYSMLQSAGHLYRFFVVLAVFGAASLFGDEFFNFPQIEMVSIPMPQMEPFLRQFGEEEAKKYDLTYVPETSEDFDLFSSEPLYLLFDYSGEWDIAKARTLLINVVADFLAKIERLGRFAKPEDQAIADYYKEHPFDFEDFTAKIRHRNKTKLFVYPTLENVSAIFLLDGRLYYETINPKSYTPNILRSESYKEAKEIADQEAARASQESTVVDKLLKPS